MTTPLRHRRSTTTRPARGLAALAVLASALLGGCSGDGDGAGPEFAPVAAPTSSPATAASGDDGLWSEGTGADTGAGATAVACEESAREPVLTDGDWRHPQQSFYTGSERRLPSATDLEHLMSTDAAAVVRYRAEQLPAASLDALRSWAETTEAVVAVPAGPEDGAARGPVVVDLVHERLQCDGLDTPRLDAFVAEREEGTGHDHE